MDIQVNSRKNIRFFITGHYDFLGGFWESENFKYFDTHNDQFQDHYQIDLTMVVYVRFRT